MKERKVPVIGSEGNVGRGVVTAFKNAGWEVLPVDPEANKAVEELTNEEFEELFSQASLVVYTADCGNREEYAENPNLGKENNQRFADFCRRMAKVNPALTVWYVGGSWTKRKPDDDWLVNDDSPNKNLKDCNPYEEAKIGAEENAREMSNLINIRFLDWASIVPNLAPNFSISRMIAQALEEGRIKYSPGLYGRPLIESVQAGEALIVLIENDDSQQRFVKYLIPGHFVPFSAFAQAAKEVVEEEAGKKITLEEMEETPDFLKSQCHSDYLGELDFMVGEKRVHAALKRNAREAFEKIKSS